jgi:hypothetical protein
LVSVDFALVGKRYIGEVIGRLMEARNNTSRAADILYNLLDFSAVELIFNEEQKQIEMRERIRDLRGYCLAVVSGLGEIQSLLAEALQKGDEQSGANQT